MSASAVLSIPAQVATCACVPDDYRACNGDFCRCDGCGFASEEPMPYAEPMDDPALDMTDAASWYRYCRSCAFEWILNGADIRRAVTA